jgi:hypothetical protein
VMLFRSVNRKTRNNPFFLKGGTRKWEVQYQSEQQA